MLLTIPLILLTCGLSLASAWISGHAEELAVQETPQRAWLPKAGFWLAVIGLSGTLFTILIPILTSFVSLQHGGGYLDPSHFIASLWPLFLVVSAALAVVLMMLVNSVRAPKPKAKIEGSGPRRFGYYGYPRSFFIFMPMRSHRRIAMSPRYYQAANAGGFAGGMSNGVRPGMVGGLGNAYQGAAGATGGMSGGMGSGLTNGAGGMSGGLGTAGNGAYQGGMRGGMSSGGGSKKSYRSNDRKMDANAGLVMLAVMAIAGGYNGAKAVKKMGGKRQAEINELWRQAEAQRVIREHDEEQEQKLKEQFADLPE